MTTVLPNRHSDSPSQFHRRSGHAQIQKADSESIGRRRKLILPTAQVGEFELEDIVKTRISRAGDNAKAVFGGSDASGRFGLPNHSALLSD